MEAVSGPAKITPQVIRLRKPDGGEERVHLFLDSNGFLTGAHGLEKLTSWERHKQAGAGAKVVMANNVTAVDVDAITRRDIRLFTDTTPCWFPECEELRRRYKEDLADMERQTLELEGRECKGCEKGVLIRKYMALAKEAQR